MPRPVTIPRARLSPLGRTLAERDITPRMLGEALAIAERRSERVETALINKWIWGHAQPSPDRRRMIAEMLGTERDEIFPPKPRKPRKPSPAEQALFERAEQLREEGIPSVNDGRKHLERVTQQPLQSSSATASVTALPSIDYRAQEKSRAARRAPLNLPARKAA